MFKHSHITGNGESTLARKSLYLYVWIWEQLGAVVIRSWALNPIGL